MPEEKSPQKTNTKGGFHLRPISIIFGISGLILLIFIIWAFFRFYGPFGGQEEIPIPGQSSSAVTKISPSPSSQFTRTSPGQTKGGKVDSALVGTWVSDCLIPDPNSPWSEKHQFVINSDGTAVHTRWSDDSTNHDCGPRGQPGTLVDNYTITIPETGKINLTDSSGTHYDIYQVNGNTLLFGHGFRNNLPYDTHTGSSEADRISSLNNYIIYSK